MKSLFLVARLVLVQILFLSTSPSLASTEVNLPPDYNIEIIKGNNGTGLHVTYLFESPVTEFVMPGRGEKPLEVRILPNSGGFIIDGNNVRHLSGEEFSAVSFTLEPDIRKIDRAYQTLFKTSRDALVLFPENLIVNDVLPDKITISAASGESVNLDGSSQRNLVLKPETLEDLRRFLMIGAWQSYRVDIFEVIGAERLPGRCPAERDGVDRLHQHRNAGGVAEGLIEVYGCHDKKLSLRVGDLEFLRDPALQDDVAVMLEHRAGF